MFQPPQVQAWPALVKNDPELRTVYAAHSLGHAVVTFDEAAKQPVIQETRGMLRSPTRIFGRPVDESCLHGIGHWPVHARASHTLVLPDARVVGVSAVLGIDGRVYTPEDVTTASKMTFVAENTYGHQRFLVEDAEDKVVIRFPQRRVQKTHRIDAAFFYNIEPGNFGSFMFRVLPQLVRAREDGRKFDCYVTPERTPFFLEALDLLGLPRKPIFTVGEVGGDLFQSLTMFCVDDAEGYLSVDVLAQIRALARRLATKGGAATGSPKRIYVSRVLSAAERPWYRVMLNEADIESLVAARGYTILYPETLRLEEQAKAFVDAERIIGPSGSGMFNAMFSEALRKVVDIETFHVTVRQHAKLYTACGAEYSFLFAPYADPQTPGGLERPYICPPPLVEAALDWLSAEA